MGEQLTHKLVTDTYDWLLHAPPIESQRIYTGGGQKTPLYSDCCCSKVQNILVQHDSIYDITNIDTKKFNIGNCNNIDVCTNSYIIAGSGHDIQGGFNYPIIGSDHKSYGYVNSILAGRSNSIYGSINSIYSGYNNCILSYYPTCNSKSVIFTGNNNNICKSWCSTLMAGEYNKITYSKRSNIISGNHNWIDYSDYTVIAAGENNETYYSYYSFIGAGHHNYIFKNWDASFCTSMFSYIFAGNNNTICGNHNIIYAGQYNKIKGLYNNIYSGCCNSIYSDYSLIFAGERNTIYPISINNYDGTNEFYSNTIILAGTDNCVIDGNSVFLSENATCYFQCSFIHGKNIRGGDLAQDSQFNAVFASKDIRVFSKYSVYFSASGVDAKFDDVLASNTYSVIHSNNNIVGTYNVAFAGNTRMHADYTISLANTDGYVKYGNYDVLLGTNNTQIEYEPTIRGGYNVIAGSDNSQICGHVCTSSILGTKSSCIYLSDITHTVCNSSILGGENVKIEVDTCNTHIAGMSNFTLSSVDTSNKLYTNKVIIKTSTDSSVSKMVYYDSTTNELKISV